MVQEQYIKGAGVRQKAKDYEEKIAKADGKSGEDRQDAASRAGPWVQGDGRGAEQ